MFADGAFQEVFVSSRRNQTVTEWLSKLGYICWAANTTHKIMLGQTDMLIMDCLVIPICSIGIDYTLDINRHRASFLSSLYDILLIKICNRLITRSNV